MISHLSPPKEVRLDVLNSYNDIALFSERLESSLQQSLIGYQIIQGYIQAINIQPYYEISGIPSLKKTFRHMRITTKYWQDDVVPGINNLYNEIRQLKLKQSAASNYLATLFDNLHQHKTRKEFIDIIEMSISDVQEVENKNEALIRKLNEFRGQLEDDAKNYKTVSNNIEERQLSETEKVKRLNSEIDVLNKEIEKSTEKNTQKYIQTGFIDRHLYITILSIIILPIVMSLHRQDLDKKIN